MRVSLFLSLLVSEVAESKFIFCSAQSFLVKQPNLDIIFRPFQSLVWSFLSFSTMI